MTPNLHPDHPRRDEVRRRVRRVEGQVRGIVRMIDEDASCYDLIVQCAAAKAALGRAANVLLKDHIESCVAHGIERRTVEQALSEVGTALDHLLR